MDFTLMTQLSEDCYACLFDTTIHVITQLNDSRLYYLWLKYLLLAGIDEKWTFFENAESTLSALQTISDISSYLLFTLRLTLNLVSSVRCTSTISYWDITNDILWGISNGLSASVLSSAVIRPMPYTYAWWGNLSMQGLLVYDGVKECIKYKIRQRALNQAMIQETNEVVNLKKHQQQQLEQYICIASISYNLLLVVGFCLFRDFLKFNLNPSIGALVCLLSTLLFIGFEWNIYKRKCAQDTSKTVLFGIGLAFSIDYFLPILVWLSLKNDYSLLTILSGLTIRTVLNTCLKYERKPTAYPMVTGEQLKESKTRPSPLFKYSLYAPVQPRIALEKDVEEQESKSEVGAWVVSEV